MTKLTSIWQMGWNHQLVSSLKTGEVSFCDSKIGFSELLNGAGSLYPAQQSNSDDHPPLSFGEATLQTPKWIKTFQLEGSFAPKLVP